MERPVRWKIALLRRGAAHNFLLMKFRLLVEFDPEAKRWSAVFPELPGCATAGDTEAEAIANAQEALALWFEPAPIKLPKGAKLIELAVP
jgi:predicted RNase H-like HicB family nuclease